MGSVPILGDPVSPEKLSTRFFKGAWDLSDSVRRRRLMAVDTTGGLQAAARKKVAARRAKQAQQRDSDDHGVNDENLPRDSRRIEEALGRRGVNCSGALI